NRSLKLRKKYERALQRKSFWQGKCVYSLTGTWQSEILSKICWKLSQTAMFLLLKKGRTVFLERHRNGSSRWKKICYYPHVLRVQLRGEKQKKRTEILPIICFTMKKICRNTILSCK